MDWVLYGAYGYTGRLILEVALARGHRPRLLGRDPQRLQALAEEHGLEWQAVGLDDAAALRQALQGVRAVLHAAGPFVFTAAPMVAACLDVGAHYLDITGEIPVFEAQFARDKQARTAGIALISGVGFDVVPTDCLAAFLAQQMPEAVSLELAFASGGGASAGTVKSMLASAGQGRGGALRRGGKLIPAPLGRPVRRVPFADRERTVAAIPWGDLSTAWRTTGIPDITTYMAVPRRLIRWMPLAPRLGRLLAVDWVHRQAEAWVERNVRGPDVETRRTVRAQVWGQVRDAAGRTLEATLTTPESYQLTAETAVRALERVLAGTYTGALTPAGAFGPDFILDVPGVERQLRA